HKPAYMHSMHVRDILLEYGYAEEVCTAGLLHDVVEDGGVSLDELKAMGFSPRVVELVDLATYDETVASSDGRWVCMVARLVRADDGDAWAIKLADIASNISDSHGMRLDRRALMLTVKAPLMLRLTEESMGATPLWKHAAETREKELIGAG
ncbi:MAG: HD domain-containing protein, partial [Candidatus Uhrbacteria bacterium]|nr:HD domain-containing protein [Candidatus Uhrbacteria bacterium]